MARVTRPELCLPAHQSPALDLHPGVRQQLQEIAVGVDGCIQCHCCVGGISLERNQDLTGHFATHHDLIRHHRHGTERPEAFTGPSCAGLGKVIRIRHRGGD